MPQASLSEEELKRLRERLTALEARDQEYRAILNRGKGVMWAIFILGGMATTALTIIGGIRGFFTAGP